jgi:hypothetical protein
MILWMVAKSEKRVGRWFVHLVTIQLFIVFHAGWGPQDSVAGSSLWRIARGQAEIEVLQKVQWRIMPSPRPHDSSMEKPYKKLLKMVIYSGFTY